MSSEATTRNHLCILCFVILFNVLSLSVCLSISLSVSLLFSIQCVVFFIIVAAISHLYSVSLSVCLSFSLQRTDFFVIVAVISHFMPLVRLYVFYSSMCSRMLIVANFESGKSPKLQNPMLREIEKFYKQRFLGHSIFLARDLLSQKYLGQRHLGHRSFGQRYLGQIVFFFNIFPLAKQFF